MPSKTSWLNKELILQILRSTGWISILYFLGLFFALPLRMLMLHTEAEEMNVTYPPFRSLFEYNFEIQIVLIIVVPVLFTVFLFRFLQVKPSADLIHSLPISRGKIFHHYALSGIISLIIPVVLTALLVMMVHSFLDLSHYFDVQDIWTWAGTTTVINLLLFTAGAFMAMMTGISALQGVLTYIFLLFPAGMTLLVLYNLELWLYGFPSDYYLTRNLETMSPLTYVAVLDGNPLKQEEVILYLILSLILYVLSLYFYTKRKVESATEAIAFPKLRLVFKYGVTFCTMLLGGMYFGEVQNRSIEWMIFGYVIGAVLGYYLAEMLLQKSWRVFSRIKGLLLYGMIILILGLGIQALGFYENHVPDQEGVQSVLFSDSPFVVENKERYGDLFIPKPLKEQENMAAVRELHQQIIKDKEYNKNMGENEQVITAFFLYELNNGESVVRQYRVNQKVYEDYYRTIHESKEFKLVTNEIFEIGIDDIDYLTIHSNAPGKTNVILNKEEDVQAVLQALQSDIMAESYKDKIYFSGRGPTLEFHLENDRFVYLEFKPTYLGLRGWLENEGLLSQAIVTPEDIASIQVARWTNGEIIHHHPEEIIKRFESSSEVVEITDKKEIAEVLNNAGWGYNLPYIAVLNYEGSYSDYLFLDEEHIPDFIKKQFK